MSVRQLYELQGIEQEIASDEKAVTQDRAKLAENEELRKAKAALDAARAELENLLQQQKSNDWALSDLTAKMTVTTEALYSGRVRNPKELTSLQQELESFKHQRDPLEEKGLELMEKLESAQSLVKERETTLSEVESRLGDEHKALHAHIAELNARLAVLKEQRDKAVALVPSDELKFYNELKERRGNAVSRMEQGTCGACRISLSSAEVQRARSGRIVQCSSCRRILFFE
jgi:predicted  nucleic acid-binding Zn-ribbon protein